MKWALIYLGIGFVLFTFIGIKYEPEFAEPEFFFKHRPNFKVEYYSPIGESDLHLEDLEGKRKQEEIAYQTYVGNYYNRDFLDHLSFFLIPLMSLCLFSGLYLLFGVISSNDAKRSFLLGYLFHLTLLFGTFAVYWNVGISGILSIVFYGIFCAAGLYFVYRKRKQTS